MLINSQTTRNPVVISQSNEDELDRNFFKIAILAILGIFLSFATVYAFNRFVLTLDYQYVWYLVLASAFFLSFLVLNVFFIKSFLILFIVIFLETFAPIALFYKELYSAPSWTLIIGFLLSCYFTVSGARKGINFLSNSLKIKFFAIAKPTLVKSVTGFLIVLTAIVYFNYFENGKLNDKIGEKLLGGVLNPANPMLDIFIKGLSFEQSGKVFFDLIAESQLKKMDLGNQQNDFQSDKAKQIMIEQTGEELRNVFAGIIGSFDPSNSVKTIIYKLIKNYLNSIPEGIQPFIGGGTLLLIFITLKGVAMFLYWIVEFIAFVIYKLLIVLGFAYINLQSRSREFIMLS